MYQLFNLEGRNIKIAGYHYACENPNHVVVLIHGRGEHAGRFARVADHFNEGGIAVVRIRAYLLYYREIPINHSF